jgi:hypothetical protein
MVRGGVCRPSSLWPLSFVRGPSVNRTYQGQPHRHLRSMLSRCCEGSGSRRHNRP